MRKSLTTSSLLIVLFIVLNAAFDGGCVYKFTDVSVDPNIKTIRIQYIENRASYVNPQLSPNLTDRLKQKINNQTRLAQTNNDNADLIVTGEVTEYYQSTSGITSQNGRSQTSINRLNVSVKITKTLPNQDPKEFTVSRQFDYPANQSLQAAESRLLDEMVRNLADEIFNHLFSDW